MDEFQQYQLRLLQSSSFREAVEDLTKTFKSFPKDHRIKTIHNIADQELKQSLDNNPTIKNRIYCKKGCAHCCYMLTTILGKEADLIVEQIKKQNLAIDFKLLHKQAAAKTQDPNEYLDQINIFDRRCAFLGKDNQCLIYNERPLVCRSYIALDGPTHCNTYKNKIDVPVFMESKQLMIWLAAASIEKENQIGPMADQLLKRLK